MVNGSFLFHPVFAVGLRTDVLHIPQRPSSTRLRTRLPPPASRPRTASRPTRTTSVTRLRATSRTSSSPPTRRRSTRPSPRPSRGSTRPPRDPRRSTRRSRVRSRPFHPLLCLSLTLFPATEELEAIANPIMQKAYGAGGAPGGGAPEGFPGAGSGGFPGAGAEEPSVEEVD